MGSFTIGFCGEDKKGPMTRWNMNPYIFDNAYFKELLLKDQSKYYRTEADLKLIQNAQLKSWVDAYAQDQDLFFRNYAKAHVKLSEIGWEGQLLSEMEPHRSVDGGYIEENRLGKVLEHLRIGLSAYMTNQSNEEFIESEEQKQIEGK